MNVQRETSHSCTAESGRAESVKVFPNCSKYTGKPRTEKGENQMKEFSHVAYLIPHTDVTGEIDCHRMLPDCVVHVKRMWLDEVSEEAERKMVQEELPCTLHYLKGITNFQCAVFGCTSASAANGREGMLAIEAMMRDALGCPAITAFGAVLRQIERYQPKTLSILTPYTEDVNAFFKKTMEEFGVSVAFIRGMGLVSDNDIAALTPEKILAFSRHTAWDLPRETDLCFFSCTNVRSAEIRQELSAVLKVLVITSNQCVIDFVRECCEQNA